MGYPIAGVVLILSGIWINNYIVDDLYLGVILPIIGLALLMKWKRDNKIKALKIIIDPKQESTIKDDPDFVLAIQLSRIVNSLRSNLRSYLKVSSDSKLMDTKDRLDLMLIHGSMLYEAIKVFSSHGKRFKKLKLWSEKEEEFKFFNRERGNDKSFTNVVLSKIRNKLFFHFDHEVISETLENFEFPNGITFLMAQSTKVGDSLYTLADDLTLTYLINLQSIEGSNEEKYKSVENQIIDFSKRLGELFDKIISELLAGKIYKAKTDDMV